MNRFSIATLAALTSVACSSPVMDLGGVKPASTVLSGGSACSSNSDCASGLCLGNTCCSEASCGTDPICQATTCNSSGGCEYPSGSCGSHCSNGVLTPSTCGFGLCLNRTQGLCPNNFACADETSCRTSCTQTSDCAAGSYCSNGGCVYQENPGTACTSNDACKTGVCGVSGTGHCCLAGWPLMPAVPCVSGDPHGCGALDCDLDGACLYPSATSICVAQSCTGHTLTFGATCDGAGVCAVPVPATADCAPYECGATGSCASDPGVIAPPWITAFNATPAALPATGGDVTLSWSVVGAKTLAIDQSIGDVSTLRSTVVHVTGNGNQRDYTLTASNDFGTVSAVAHVWLAGTYDVHGRLVDVNRGPLVAATVMVPGGVSTQSAADGTFTLLAVAAPYDLLVAAGSVDVALYRGITRPDPTVTVFHGQDGISSSASIHGGLSSDAGFGRGSWNLGFVSDEAFPGSFTPNPSWYAADGGFTQTIQWAGSGPTTGTLFGLKGTN